MWLETPKDASKRSKVENKGKKEMEAPKGCAAKSLGCVASLFNYRGWEQDLQGWKSGDKGIESGRAGYRKQKVLT